MKLFSFRFVTVPALFLLVTGAAADWDYSRAMQGVSDDCPEWITGNQVLLDVAYWGFDGGIHRGSLLADARVITDLRLVFTLMFLTGFPMESVTPISELGWNDSLSMEENNTSGFNYRTVPGTDRLSRHAYGLAIDINPAINPYYSGNTVSPPGAVYDPSHPGTLTPEHPVVLLFKQLGWRWGGDWIEKDYQHFDKQLEPEELTVQHHHPRCFQWRLL